MAAENDSLDQKMAQACIKGDSDTIKDLLINDFDFSQPVKWVDSEGTEFSSPPIFIAADYGHAEAVRELLKGGISSNLSDGDYTIVQWASWKGNVEIVQLLLQHDGKADEEALDLARDENHEDVVKILLQHVDLYSSLEGNVDDTMDKACRQGDMAKVKQLMDNNYDYQKWRDEKGDYHQYSPVFMALKNGHMDIVQLFTEAGHNVSYEES